MMEFKKKDFSRKVDCIEDSIEDLDIDAFITLIEEQELLEPPKTLKNNILVKIDRIEERKKVLEAYQSPKAQLFFYTCKMGIGMAASLCLLLGLSHASSKEMLDYTNFRKQTQAIIDTVQKIPSQNLYDKVFKNHEERGGFRP